MSSILIQLVASICISNGVDVSFCHESYDNNFLVAVQTGDNAEEAQAYALNEVESEVAQVLMDETAESGSSGWSVNKGGSSEQSN